jgi:hypothetical protein
MGREEFELVCGGFLVEHTRLVGRNCMGVASHERGGVVKGAVWIVNGFSLARTRSSLLA